VQRLMRFFKKFRPAEPGETVSVSQRAVLR
jgi:hypothetical protein